jgi:putative pyruvate formate lyase activating enzyme
MSKPTRREFSGELIGITLASGVLAGCGIPAAARPIVRPRKDWTAGYLHLEQSGELARREAQLRAIYESCRLCPRACGVNRLRGKTGVCGLPARLKIASSHPHFGEERPLVGRGGSGTIFFSHCNLLCEFCQNWPINHRGDGVWHSDRDCARLMIALQDQGCHNINLVTPSHCVPSIVSALRVAIGRGLRLPLVYNCSGYEPVEVLRLLDGIVDIYLPDFKFTDPEAAARIARGVSDYPQVARAAIREMHRQVGPLTVDENGIAFRGLLVRHLVLPNNQAGTDRFVEWMAEDLGPDTSINIMGQYRPEHRASQFPEIARRVTRAEYRQALDWARQAGLKTTSL